jgi:hypothetical protein
MGTAFQGLSLMNAWAAIDIADALELLNKDFKHPGPLAKEVAAC